MHILRSGYTGEHLAMFREIALDLARADEADRLWECFKGVLGEPYCTAVCRAWLDENPAMLSHVLDACFVALRRGAIPGKCRCVADCPLPHDFKHRMDGKGFRR